LLLCLLAACAPSPNGRDNAEPAEGIPLTLATSRASAIEQVRYQLAFDIPADAASPINGKATIRFVARNAVREPLQIDFAADRGPEANHLTSVTVNGKAVDRHWVNGHIVIAPASLATGENSIDVGFIAGDVPLNRNPDFLYTIFVPARAHEAFPCFDQPDLKARYALELTVPADWQAVANGAEAGREPVGDRVRVRFAETQPIPTYLFAFAAGKFQIETGERNGRTFRMFHRETDARKVARNRDAVFDLQGSALKWLEDYTAIPYQFGKFDFVLVPSFQFGGMEHPGSIFYNAASVLLDESATESQMLNRANLIAHETSHMWFGDLVTMRWFDDVWMKEVFANFMAAKIANPAFPKINHELRFLVSNYPAAYSVDRTAGTHPIRQQLENLNEAGSLYGAIIYEKAPIVMRQLERLIGETTMRDGLREYLKQFSFGNATWPDLVKVLDDRTERDLQTWSHVWVEEAGRPLFKTEWETNDEGRRQIAFIQHDGRPDRSLHWTEQMDVLIGTPGDTRNLLLETKSERTELPDGMMPRKVDFVLPTGGGLAYGGFMLDDASRRFLLEHVEELKDPVARGATWITLWEEMLNGLVDPADLIESQLRALPREDTEQNIQLVTSQLQDLFWRCLADRIRRPLTERIERTLRAGLSRATTSSLKSTYFTAFRNIVTTPGGIAWLERVWRRTETIPGLPFSEPDEATMALELAVRSVPNAGDILEEQRRRFQNPDRKARFEFVMPALSEQAETRDAFFKSLADARNRRREPWVTEGLSYLNHPLRAAAAVKYIGPSLDLLEDIKRTGDIFFPKNWMDALLEGHNSPAASEAVRTFLNNHPADQAAAEGKPLYPIRLRRIILQSADNLLRAADIVPTW